MNKCVQAILTTFIVSFFCLITSPTYACGKKSVSPIAYGLLEAKDGQERYRILLRTHKEAIEKGLTVNYKGIDVINITIPKDATTIPLGADNDFSGVVFNVNNTSKELFLFSYINKQSSIAVSAEDVDKGRFQNVNLLAKGRYLLRIEDQYLWVENRIGYTYGHKRRDILLVKNGKAVNKAIMTYNNAYSSPICQVYKVEYPHISLSNLTINRTKGSTKITYLCKIVGADDVRFDNVTINTPQNDMVDDLAISIIDCTNVNLEHVTINGTYSQSNHSGYGISMNNVWNFHAKRLVAMGNWGVFGNNNINTAFIENSTINRFDIHCYGRDVTFKNVEFVNLYNQFSSTFGTISFDNCTFNKFIPVLYESSYNAYSPHDVVFKRCTFYMGKRRNCLIDAGSLITDVNSRTELTNKSWPNVSINKMKVFVDKDIDTFNIFGVAIASNFKGKVDYLESIKIKDLTFENGDTLKPIKINVVNKNITTSKAVEVSIDRLTATLGSTLGTRINQEDVVVDVRRSSVKVIDER